MQVQEIPSIAIEVFHGDGQMVSVLAFYSGNPSLHPAEVFSFFCLIARKE